MRKGSPFIRGAAEAIGEPVSGSLSMPFPGTTPASITARYTATAITAHFRAFFSVPVTALTSSPAPVPVYCPRRGSTTLTVTKTAMAVRVNTENAEK